MMHITPRHRRVAAYVFVCLGFLGMLALEQHNHNQEIARDCQSRQSGRETLREVILVATTPTGSSSSRIDFTKVPGFDKLDEFQQVYLVNLGKLLSSSGTSVSPPPAAAGQIPTPDPNNTTQKALLDRAPQITC